MRATTIEYRLRFAIHALIYVLCFWAPWAQRDSLTTKTAWVTLSSLLFEHHWLSFMQATDVLLIVAIFFAATGAWFRLWGSAYVGSDVVASRAMHGQALLADGPYRRTRNPLYLGTLLFTVGISLLMHWTGAAICIALIWIFQFRLALAEEVFLAAKFGAPYVEYKQLVPRFLPAPSPLIPSAGQQPRWLQSLAGEFYFVAVAVLLATVGWSFNATMLVRGLLYSLGAWLIVRAFLPKPKD
ncbi:methyltransferase family protein [Granulicella cerasi]|uniref:Methyltransferase family protein n=1 Tax=Granulicella cerasi TaxID=741063 RepID=A0ABW1ZCR6_9BACT|nr:isoprenylcysteine carboxylmethyltransferase family protein [Granulicella cerasi]